MYAFVSDRLIRVRTAAALSREQVAVGACVSANSIVAYENGLRAPSGHVLIAIAATLGIDPRDLYEEVESEAAAV